MDSSENAILSVAYGRLSTLKENPRPGLLQFTISMPSRLALVSLELLLLATCVTAFSTSGMIGLNGPKLALRSGTSSTGVVRSGARIGGRGTSLVTMKVTPEEEALFRAQEDARIAAKRAQEIEVERRYIQQSSGLNYRKNSQDKFIFAVGTMPCLLAIFTHFLPSNLSLCALI